MEVSTLTESIDPNLALLIALAILVSGALLGIGLVLGFLYRTGRLGVRLAERGIDATARLGCSALETTGVVVEKAAEAIRDGAGSIGGALREYARRQNSESIYAALMEVRPSLELTTCKLKTVVVAKKVRGKNICIQMMPVRISYGYDFSEFSEQDIRVNKLTGTMRISLPPLRITAMERGPRKDLYSQAALLSGRAGMDLVQEIESILDEKMRRFASTEAQIALAEEVSKSAFRQVIDVLLFPLPAKARPRAIELVPSSVEQGPPALPESLRLEDHHDPEEDLSDAVSAAAMLAPAR